MKKHARKRGLPREEKPRPCRRRWARGRTSKTRLEWPTRPRLGSGHVVAAEAPAGVEPGAGAHPDARPVEQQERRIQGSDQRRDGKRREADALLCGPLRGVAGDSDVRKSTRPKMPSPSPNARSRTRCSRRSRSSTRTPCCTYLNPFPLLFWWTCHAA